MADLPSPNQAQSSGRTLESSTDEVSEVTSRLSNVQLDKVSASSPALKLPPLFSLMPNSSGRGGNIQKRQILTHTNQVENVSGVLPHDQSVPNGQIDSLPQDNPNSYVLDLKKSVREAALAMQSSNIECSQENHSDDSSEHHFVPLSGPGFSRLGPEKKGPSLRSKQLFVYEENNSCWRTIFWMIMLGASMTAYLTHQMTWFLSVIMSGPPVRN